MRSKKLTRFLSVDPSSKANEGLDHILHSSHPSIGLIELIRDLDDSSYESDQGRDDLTDAVLHGWISSTGSKEEGLGALEGGDGDLVVAQERRMRVSFERRERVRTNEKRLRERKRNAPRPPPTVSDR